MILLQRIFHFVPLSGTHLCDEPVVIANGILPIER